MATKQLADWVEQLRPASLPKSVTDAAIKSFSNYVGCAIGGHNHEATQIAIKTFASLPQVQGVASLIGSKSAKTDPFQAALINGVASHVHDYDDTHLSTIIHPTAAVASALLAFAEYSSERGNPLPGTDFIGALVAGIEVECLLGLSVWPSHYDVGWHITATVGSIGAAVAVGKSMKLSSDELVHAIGISSAQAAGMRRHFGSHTKALGVGLAAQAGLQAALMARNGLNAAVDSIEGRRGWIECVCPEQAMAKIKLNSFVKKLLAGKGLNSDGRWEVEKNAFKPYPCGIVIHPVINGCSQLRGEGLEADKVESVELLVHPLVLELTGKQLPKDGLEAKFSVSHGAACGLMFGKATPAEYADAVVAQTAELREKIQATADLDLKADACHITVHTSGGVVEKHVEHAIGSLSSPMTTDQLRQKFVDQAAPVVGQSEAQGMFASLNQVLELADVKTLFEDE